MCTGKPVVGFVEGDPEGSTTSIISEAFEGTEDPVAFENVVPAIRALKERGLLMGAVGNDFFWLSNLTIRLPVRIGLPRYMEVLIFQIFQIG